MRDDRNGSTTAWNTWYRRTTDGGKKAPTLLSLSLLSLTLFARWHNEKNAIWHYHFVYLIPIREPYS